MPRLLPFEALVYDPSVVGPLDDVTAPPYDVISEMGGTVYRARPFSIVQLDLVEAGADGSYDRAGALLRDWIGSGALRRMPTGYHAYEMLSERDGEVNRVRGVLCALELEDWGGGILPHERTMPGPVEDRLRLLRATRTHLSAVYATVPGPCADLEELLEDLTRSEADAAATDEEGVVHRRWAIDAAVPIDSWLANEAMLIADGHHRYTTALAYRDEMRATHGPGPWDRLLVFVVDAGSQRLTVRPFHRLQHTGTGPTEARSIGGLDALMDALDDEDPVVGLVDRTSSGLRYRALTLAGDPPAVRALHEGFLDAHVAAETLRYTPELSEAIAAVECGEATVAYLLPPTTPDRIRAVVQRGERLPQKSTFFWPKPRTGMALMPVDGTGVD